MIESINRAITQLNEYICTNGKTQAAVSKEIGISPGTLSQFLSGSYIGANEEIAEKYCNTLKESTNALTTQHIQHISRN